MNGTITERIVCFKNSSKANQRYNSGKSCVRHSFFFLIYLLTVQNTFTDKRILLEEKCTAASYSYLYYFYIIHVDISM